MAGGAVVYQFQDEPVVSGDEHLNATVNRVDFRLGHGLEVLNDSAMPLQLAVLQLALVALRSDRWRPLLGEPTSGLDIGDDVAVFAGVRLCFSRMEFQTHQDAPAPVRCASNLVGVLQYNHTKTRPDSLEHNGRPAKALADLLNRARGEASAAFCATESAFAESKLRSAAKSQQLPPPSPS